MVEPCSRDVPETNNSKCVVDKKVQICLVVFEAPWRNSNHCVLVKQKKIKTGMVPAEVTKRTLGRVG